MKSVKLYEKDSFLTTCKAKVIDQKEVKGKIGYIFDQTVLYPTGGGQPNDLGKVNQFDVEDVAVVEDEIVNYINGTLEIGEEVEMHIDFDRRFDHMQQHSGEHIISGVLCSLYNCDNVGFHMGKEEILIDYNTILDEKSIKIAELKANEAIYKNQDCDIYLYDGTIDYRSKKELTGDIRIVEFAGYDRCACCGTHVKKAGQVGLILVTGFEYIKKGTRIHLLCGKRANEYIDKMQKDAKKVSALVSRPIGELEIGVAKLNNEINQLKEEISFFKKEYIHSIAAGLTGDVIFYQNDHLDASSSKLLLNELEGKEVFILFNGMFNYVSKDVNPFLNNLRKSFNVKGGGKNNFAQGKIDASIEQIQDVYQRG